MITIAQFVLKGNWTCSPEIDTWNDNLCHVLHVQTNKQTSKRLYAQHWQKKKFEFIIFVGKWKHALDEHYIALNIVVNKDYI